MPHLEIDSSFITLILNVFQGTNSDSLIAFYVMGLTFSQTFTFLLALLYLTGGNFVLQGTLTMSGDIFSSHN